MGLSILIHELSAAINLVTLSIKTFDCFQINKENDDDDDGWLLLASLDKSTKDKDDLCDKIRQLLAFHNKVKAKMNLVTKLTSSRYTK